MKYLSPWRSLTHSKLKICAFHGQSPGNCQEWDTYKEICPREFPARGQMTSAERGWVSDHETQNCFDQTQRHCPFHGTASGIPKERTSKKSTKSLQDNHPSTSTTSVVTMPDYEWSHQKGSSPPPPPAPALCVLCLVTQSCPTLCDPMDCSPPGSSVHGDSPGKNTGVGCHALLQGIFPTWGSNPDLLHCWQIIHCLSHQGSPKGTQNPNQRVGREGKVKNKRCQPHDLPTL